MGDSFTTRSAKSEEDGDFDCVVLCLGLFVAVLNELCSLSMGASLTVNDSKLLGAVAGGGRKGVRRDDETIEYVL